MSRKGGKRSSSIQRASQPTAERLRHGPVQRLTAPILAHRGEYAQPLKALDTLACMERQGTIGPDERQAGDRFHDLFRLALLDSMHAADPTRIPVILAKGSNRHVVEGRAAARELVLAALDALGGVHSAGGSCAWHVLGCEIPLARWALTVGWAGRRINRHAASGILLADLGILRAHWGL